MGFIYKITNAITNKCYIGETIQQNPEKRWKQHIQKINRNDGCPALRDAIKKHGVTNFKFEILIICFDDDRYKYEIEYIKKYNSQVPNGYNILPGGEMGKSRLGIKHTEKSKIKMSESTKKFYIENPNHYETYREKHKYSMNKVDISSAMRNSEKWKQVVEEGRVGGNAHKDGQPSDETKNKIRESVLKYYEDPDSNNIEKHREIMTACKGRKIEQYTINDTLVKEYISIRDAGRTSGVKKSNIQKVLSGDTKTAGGYVWKYATNTVLNN